MQIIMRRECNNIKNVMISQSLRAQGAASCIRPSTDPRFPFFKLLDEILNIIHLIRGKHLLFKPYYNEVIGKSQEA
jgi:hypothetical protein